MSEKWRIASLPDGRFMVRYRKPKGRGYFNPHLVEVKNVSINFVHIRKYTREEYFSPAMAIRLDLGDRYRKVRARKDERKDRHG